MQFVVRIKRADIIIFVASKELVDYKISAVILEIKPISIFEKDILHLGDSINFVQQLSEV